MPIVGHCVHSQKHKKKNQNCPIHLSQAQSKVYPRRGHDGPDRQHMYSSTISLTLALDGSGLSTPCPGCFTPGEDPGPIVQKAGWVPGPVWMGVESLTPTRIRQSKAS